MAVVARDQDVDGRGTSVSQGWRVSSGLRLPGRKGSVLCFANQKGGVGKTASAVSLVAALAEEGLKCLLVDADPQGNATRWLGIRDAERRPGVYEAICLGLHLREVMVPSSVPGVWVAPASIRLAGGAVELARDSRGLLRLREAVRGLEEFDLVVVDSPPSMGVLSMSALVASEFLVVPVQCEYLALEGLGQILESVERVRASYNPHLGIIGILLTMWDGRTRLSADVEQEVRKHFGGAVFGSVIPRSVRIAEAPSYGLPITSFAPDSSGAAAYREFARELWERICVRIGGSGRDGQRREEGGGSR